MIKQLITITIVFFFLLSCNKTEKDIESHLAKINIDSSFKLDTVNTAKWDFVYMVAPYQEIELTEYEIPTSIKEKIQTRSINDGYSSLLFFQDKELVNYSFVLRTIADFSQLNDVSTFSSNQEYYLNEKRIVTIK